MILSYQSIKARGPYLVSPMVERQVHAESGLTFGLGPCGYDIRLRQTIVMTRGTFRLGSSIERFIMPDDLTGHVMDKSTLIRTGLFVGNTVLEPGWCGHLTLELLYAGIGTLVLHAGQPIAQVQFLQIDQATALPYAGKYQDQIDDVVEPIRESVA